MTWVRIDDGFAGHPKIVGLTDAAFRGFVTGLCFASRYLTDGAIPTKAISSVTSAKARRELVAAGLWDEAEDGVVIHDFLTYNPPRSKVEDSRRKTADRVRGWRDRNGTSNAVTDPVTTKDVTPLQTKSNAVGNAVSNAAPGPSPTPSSTRAVLTALPGGEPDDANGPENTFEQILRDMP